MNTEVINLDAVTMAMHIQKIQEKMIDEPGEFELLSSELQTEMKICFVMAERVLRKGDK